MSKPLSDPTSRVPGILGRALRPLPLLPLEIALQSLVSAIVDRHPQLLERLQLFHGRSIGIDPLDVPLAFVLEPLPSVICVRVVRKLQREQSDVHIRGPLLALIGMVDGEYDADALFFSRDITIEGDIETALALRNAIDDAEINLAGEVAASLAALSGCVRHAAGRVAGDVAATVFARRSIFR
jgi:O2-independent ubiquinone biosynthesis accessory factor UbiT